MYLELAIICVDLEGRGRTPPPPPPSTKLFFSTLYLGEFFWMLKASALNNYTNTLTMTTHVWNAHLLYGTMPGFRTFSVGEGALKTNCLAGVCDSLL